MENKVVEVFKTEVELDGSYLSCISELLNTLVLRVKFENKEMEYRFYDVVEYSQIMEANELSEIVMINSSEWQAKLINQSSDVGITSINHYLFKMKNYSFHILGPGYVKEEGFVEVYAEQQTIKDLVK